MKVFLRQKWWLVTLAIVLIIAGITAAVLVSMAATVFAEAAEPEVSSSLPSVSDISTPDASAPDDDLAEVTASFATSSAGAEVGQTGGHPTSATFYASDRPFNFNETKRSETFARSEEDGDPTWYFGDDAYSLRDGKSIVKYDLLTGGQETIYTDSETLDQVYLEPKMAYIRKGDTIYRLYLPTKEIDDAFSNEALEDFYPVSSNQITVDLANPEWIGYVEETGDTENEPGIRETIKYNVDLTTGKMTEVIGYRGVEITSQETRAVSTGIYGV